MKSKYDEIFSAFGYDSVGVILGIDPGLISETEIQKLVRLILLSEKDKALASKIEAITTETTDSDETKLQILLQMENANETLESK